MEHSPTTAPIPFKSITRNPFVIAGVIVALIMILLGIFAPFIAPYHPIETDFASILAKPSSAHWLGTDQLGRDVLSRLIYSFRVYLYGGGFVFALSTCAAVILVALRTKSDTEQGIKGLPPGGILEYPVATLSMVIIFGGYLPLIMLMGVLGPSLNNVFVPTAILFSILPMSLVYQAVRWSLQREASSGEVQLTDTAVGPNPVSLAIRTSVALAPVTFSLAVLVFLLLESSLSFSGLGAPLDVPSLGIMLSTNLGFHIATGYWLWVFPGAVVVIAVGALAAITLPISRVQRSFQVVAEIPAEGMEFADFWVRIASILIDQVVLSLAVVIFVILLPVSGFLAFVVSILAFVYAVVFLGGRTQSVGNRLLRIKVVRADGAPVAIWRSALRALCMFVPPGYFLIPINRRRRALYDILAGTVVITQRRT